MERHSMKPAPSGVDGRSLSGPASHQCAEDTVLARLDSPGCVGKGHNGIANANRVTKACESSEIFFRVNLKVDFAPKVDLVGVSVPTRNTVFVGGQKELDIAAGRTFDLDLTSPPSLHLNVVPE